MALIPARAGSKGIPGKNLRKLGGRTLVQHALACAWAAGPGGYVSPAVTGVFVVVSTDLDPRTLGLQDPHNMRVEVIPRPPQLAQDDTPMLAVVQHALAQVPGPDDQIIVLLQPTQPFRTPQHVQQVIARLRETQADSVVSVVELPASHHPQFVLEIDTTGRLEPNKLLREDGCYTLGELRACRQAADPVYLRDGTVYAFWRKTVSQYGDIYGQDVRPMVIPTEESCELDTEQNWQDVVRRWQTMHGEA